MVWGYSSVVRVPAHHGHSPGFDLQHHRRKEKAHGETRGEERRGEYKPEGHIVNQKQNTPEPCNQGKLSPWRDPCYKLNNL